MDRDHVLPVKKMNRNTYILYVCSYVHSSDFSRAIEMYTKSMDMIGLLQLDYYWTINIICHKSGNFHVEIIHVVNIHVDLFSWVFGRDEPILPAKFLEK